jgi:chromosome segregation ATPase
LEELDGVMARMPSSVLWSQGVLHSFEATGRRLANVRTAVNEATSSAASAAAQVALLGDHAVSHENELEQVKRQLAMARADFEDALVWKANFEDARRQLENVLSDIEAANIRDREMKEQFRRFEESDERLERELNDARYENARLRDEHFELKESHEKVQHDNLRLEVDSKHYRESAEEAIAQRVRLEMHAGGHGVTIIRSRRNLSM